MSKEDTASPTAMTESILLTATIEARENRDIMTVDIPNAFIQTDYPVEDERVIMKIRGPLVDMLVELDPETYREYVVFEGKSHLWNAPKFFAVLQEIAQGPSRNRIRYQPIRSMCCQSDD
jgi:hypothetical protein